MRTFEWEIESIVSSHPDLYLEHCVVMAVASMSQYSTSPCEFIVECEGLDLPLLKGEASFGIKVSWNAQTAVKAQLMWQTEQRKAIIERAAVALAALLFARLFTDGKMRVTRQGEHADYWLSHLQCALEVSGTENHHELSRRHREKVAQVLSNPLRWDGYVVICCFAKSQNFIRLSYHQQGDAN